MADDRRYRIDGEEHFAPRPAGPSTPISDAIDRVAAVHPEAVRINPAASPGRNVLRDLLKSPKLWLLERETPEYDEPQSYVVRAHDETQARRVAADNAKGTDPAFPDSGWGVWLDARLTTCTHIGLGLPGEPGVVLRSDLRG